MRIPCTLLHLGIPPSQANSDDEDNQLEVTTAEQKLAPWQIFQTSRHRCWKRYKQHTKKTWFNKMVNLKVKFLNEDAVGKKGPNREFFQGIIEAIA